MTTVNSSILHTLAYYDIFDCPLTTLELFHSLSVKSDYAEVLESLDALVQAKTIHQQQGFYSLRPDLVVTRQTRYATSRRKLKKARLIARLLGLLPWIKFIGLANQIGQHNLRNDGDLDFFIITEKGQLWTSRFFCASLMAVMRQRPSINKSQDTICLSFFISENNLQLQRFHLDQSGDIYFTYWLANLFPLYDSGQYYQKLISANTWLQDQLPNWSARMSPRNHKYQCLQTLLSPWGLLEKKLKNWQMLKLPLNIREHSNQSSKVVINDEVLKFHTIDRRRDFMERYQTKLSELGLN